MAAMRAIQLKKLKNSQNEDKVDEIVIQKTLFLYLVILARDFYSILW